MKLFFYTLDSFFLLLVLCLIVFLLSFSLQDSFVSKGSPFECGFQSFSGSGFSFSMPFFVISLMFLLFDVEVLLVSLYPLFFSFSFYYSSYLWLIVVAILLATLYEWVKGVLSWV